MTGNVACFSPGCSNPVIGQCPGYDGQCGHFYCAQHSVDKLCSECGNRKRMDEATERIYQDYLATAKDLYNSQRNRGLATMIALSPLIILVSQPALQAQGNSQSGTIVFIIAAWIIWGIPAVWFRLHFSSKLNEIEITRPYFSEFYNTYRKQRNRAQNATLLRIVGAAALVGLGVAAAASQAQLQSDVRDIRDKLNRM